jgi:RNA methyltransferase, TrmH family
MATRLGVHAERLKAARALKTLKGRRQSHRFAFEGLTLLAEARAAGLLPEELFVTQDAYDDGAEVRELERSGTPTYIVEPSALAQLSDLTTPSGVIAVASQSWSTAAEALDRTPLCVVLADSGDPANAGTILRSADAFGCAAAIFGDLGVEAYNPKVVRGSMGAIFRLKLATCGPDEFAALTRAAGVKVVGLAAGGRPVQRYRWEAPCAVVVGHERHGLGRWEACCSAVAGIPMSARAESLSAGVAASIALYQASLAMACQESVQSLKSQDYRV